MVFDWAEIWTEDSDDRTKVHHIKPFKSGVVLYVVAQGFDANSYYHARKLYIRFHKEWKQRLAIARWGSWDFTNDWELETDENSKRIQERV